MSAPAEFTIGEVAAMLGLSTHTIRAWERRHHVLTPQRTASGHRRYRRQDVELLREVVTGVSVRGLSLKVAVGLAQGELADLGLRAAPFGEGASEPPWRAVADRMPLPAAILDADGRIVDASAAFARAAGLPRERLPGRYAADLRGPGDFDTWPIRSGGRQLVVLIGRAESPAGMANAVRR
jgi:PAS domain-containing protein